MKSCATCKFHSVDTGADKVIYYECRYEPRKVQGIFIPQPGGQFGYAEQTGGYPKVSRDDWCGKFEPELH